MLEDAKTSKEFICADERIAMVRKTGSELTVLLAEIQEVIEVKMEVLFGGPSSIKPEKSKTGDTPKAGCWIDEVLRETRASVYICQEIRDRMDNL